MRAPRDHFEPAFVSIVECKCPVVNLVASGYYTIADLLDSTKRLIIPLGPL